jgi:hypothetical protein
MIGRRDSDGRFPNATPAGRVARAGNRLTRDPLIYAVAILGLTYVWRIQDILTPLAFIKFPTLIGLAALTMYSSDRLRVRRLRFVRSWILRLLLAFAIIIAAGIPTSLLASKSLGFLLKDFLPDVLMVVLVAACVRGARDLDWLLAVHMCGATLYGLYALLFFDIDYSGRLGRILYYDGNDLALATVSTVPLAIYFLRDGSPRWQRRIALLALPVLLVNFVRAASRGGFLGLLTVILCLMIGYRPIKARRRITAFALSVAAISIFGGSTFWKTMQTILAPNEDYNMTSETGRWQLWQNGLSIVRQRPFLGVGARLFPEGEATLSDLGRLRAEMQERQLPWQAAHNSYISVTAETGIFGFILFVSLLLTGVGTALKALRMARVCRADDLAALSRALAVALAGYTVSAAFLSAEYQAILYLNLGYVLAARKLTHLSHAAQVETIAPRAARAVVCRAHMERRHR